MEHVRKMIRRVLDEMGVSNQFQICDESIREYHKDDPLVVIIRDWEPSRNAIELKKRIKCCDEDGCIDVRFELKGRCDDMHWKHMSSKKLPNTFVA